MRVFLIVSLACLLLEATEASSKAKTQKIPWWNLNRSSNETISTDSKDKPKDNPPNEKPPAQQRLRFGIQRTATVATKEETTDQNTTTTTRTPFFTRPSAAAATKNKDEIANTTSLPANNNHGEKILDETSNNPKTPWFVLRRSGTKSKAQKKDTTTQLPAHDLNNTLPLQQDAPSGELENDSLTTDNIDNSTTIENATITETTVPTTQNVSTPLVPPTLEEQLQQLHLMATPTFIMPQQPQMMVMRGPHGAISPQQPGNTIPSSSAIILASVAGLISTALRIWFLTSLTHWFSDNHLKTLVQPTQHFMWERLNDRYAKDHAVLETALKAPPLGVRERPWKRKWEQQARQEKKLIQQQQQRMNGATPTPNTFNKTVVVVDIRAQSSGELDIPHLSEVITFLLSQHRQCAFGSVNGTSKELEVVLIVESPGGAVAHFGLAAAEVGRLRKEEGITSTLIADKIIASGGYMVACQANKLLAAPFAIVGSIGVIRESYSIHKLLQKYGIEPVSLKAGEEKAPLTLLAEVTKTDIDKTQKSLDKMHIAFKELVVAGRPMLADTFEDVCQGAIYLGDEAKDLRLIDDVMTSEEYILERIQAGDRVLKLHRVPNFVKQRRQLFKELNPLDFIREHGSNWLRGQDMSQLISKLLQTTTVLHFVQFILRQREG